MTQDFNWDEKRPIKKWEFVMFAVVIVVGFWIGFSIDRHFNPQPKHAAAEYIGHDVLVVTDDNGCQYITKVGQRSGITPRLDRNGQPICVEATQ